MSSLPHLIENNRKWAARIEREDPGFFRKLAAQQKPEYLWIGCADSRVPANEIVGLLPGELFVHRNVGNLVVHSDMNCLSVLQFAIEVLKVRHVIVCGHYGCGGVKAAVDGTPNGMIDNWLRHMTDIYRRERENLKSLDSPESVVDRLCELNVVEQAYNVTQTSVVQDAWRRAQELNVYGWIYDISDGLLQDLGVRFSSPADT